MTAGRVRCERARRPSRDGPPAHRACSWLIRNPPIAEPDGQTTSLSADLHPLHRARHTPLAVGGLRMSQEFRHEPVMLAEVLALLEGCDDGVLVDATVGGAGHASALLAAHHRLRLVGIDRDPEAVEAARRRLAPFGGRTRVHQARFDQLREVVEADHGPATAVAAVFFDLGVSSHQLDVAARGFSYREPGPLDMRMDPGQPMTAGRLVNSASEAELAALFAANGEDRFARRIARFIVERRPLESTTELTEAVSAAVPVAARRRGHPARRVFQALRIAVNEELELLGDALDEAIDLLAPGGRCVVLAYHSGEDRLVKSRFVHAATGGCTCPPGLPCACGAVSSVRLLTRGARKASPAEVAANPRAESARLRAVERLPDVPRPADGQRGTGAGS